jgi:hypothetical protein
MSLPPITPLPDHLTTRGADPSLLGRELIDTIKNAIAHYPRSLQKRIGPSELGHPCPRRIGYKLAGADEINVIPDDAPWLPTVGTAVHAWLEDVFTDANASEPVRSAGHSRWLVEQRVSVGEVGGVDVTGSADLYDRVTAAVVDWKIVGPTTLKKYKASGPGHQYRSQAHLYGRGFTRRGLPVDTVMIAFLPRNGELRDAHLWHEAYDEQVALDALQRANGIALALDALGPAAVAQLDTADAYCRRCPFYRANSTDLTAGCPGDKNAGAAGNPFADLLAG